MNVEKETLPRWGWMLVGLLALAILASVVNVALLAPLGFPADYHVVTSIAAMSPVLIYVGIWYDEDRDRERYWEHTRLRIVGDLAFIVVGAALGSATTIAVVGDAIATDLLRDLGAMVVGFVTGWALFWFRNPELYGTPEPDR